MLRGIAALPRTVWLVGLVSLLNDSASEMLYPLVPLYLASVLMAGPKALGLIEGLAEATASLLKLVSGVLSDRMRRTKPWLVFGYGIAGFARPLVAFVASWPWLLCIRVADRVGKGLRSSPRDALLAGSVAPGQRGLAFGLHRAMDNAGAVAGPLLAALFLAAGMPLRDIFLWSVLPAIACVGLTLLMREPAALPSAAQRGFDWRVRDMPPMLRRYLAVLALFTLGNSSNMFLLLRASELGVPASQVPLLWGAVSAVAMVFSTPLAALSDRWGRKRLLVGGYCAYAVFYLALGWTTPGLGMLFVLFAGYGLFLAATEATEKALVADLAPADRRGTAFGWFNLVAGALLLPASALFGWLYETVSPALAFGVSAACSAGAAGLMLGWVHGAPDRP